MLQSAITMSPTAPVNSKAMGTGANNRPTPAAQDTNKTEADTASVFSTELQSASGLKDADLAQPDAVLVDALTIDLADNALATDAGQLPAIGEENSQQTGQDTAAAEEWILNMLGQQSAQLQARDLSQAIDDINMVRKQDVQATIVSTQKQFLETTTVDTQTQYIQPNLSLSVSANKAPDFKQSLDQQALVELDQSATQKQSRAHPTLVITNTGDSDNTQAAINGQIVDSANDPTPGFSTNAVAERAVNQTADQAVDQTKNAITNALTDRLGGIAPAQSHDGAASSISNATNQTLTDAVPERTLKLHGTEAKWGEQMLQTLRENVGLQLQHRQQNATIRLDPPELGSMEIFLSHESGRLTVQISASQGDVARLLQQTSDRLRQELVNQQFVQVNVQVSSDNHGGQRHSQQQSAQWNEEQITQNHQSAETTSSGKNTTHNDILVTV
ncbi:MAG: flagellar hook-length control protein FliK [Cellvibrio sp.]|uniref:flagellar hook-length control protein FliK n=1 Tax=Cellvibrio sp. TaxID=1965322 RepID=UPI0031B3D2D3